jgi:NAD(P)-dependent dehydrogenase (short-subunit alcohol dehydrogenase family)
MAPNLEGRTVIIAGAAGGLGSVAAAQFAAAGANLALLGREQTKLDDLAESLKLPDARVLALACDVTSQVETGAAAEQIQKQFGGIHVLLNVVGGWIGGKPIFETAVEDVQSMLAQHLIASYTMIRAFVPAMVAGKWGRIFAISSPFASRPPGKNSPYAIGKSAMEALVLSLAQEVKGSGVTANLILVKTIDVNHEREINPTKENAGWTSPEEISATLLHLCSEEAGVINGARVPLYLEPY